MDTIEIGNRKFDRAGRTYVMGILNVTPDSFSDGGAYVSTDDALRHAEAMIAAGADLIDVGGESTRPGHAPVSAEEEAERVLPVVRALKARFDIPISLDTSKPMVARAGVAAGADLINDIWGLRGPLPGMAAAVAETGVPVCVMHNRTSPIVGDPLVSVLDDLGRSLAAARAAGVGKEKIILDPGVGFAKTQEQNLALIHRIARLGALGCPLLLGVSRKSVIGYALGLPVGEREEGTLAASVYAATQGVQFVRVHDVAASVRAIRMTEAILKEKKAW